MSIEEKICAQLSAVRFEDLPEPAVRAVKSSILDTIGVMLVSSTASEDCVKINTLMRELGGRPESTVIGFGDRLPSPAAAFINGALCHPLDYDDVHEGAKNHSTAQTLPAALAVAQRKGNVTGRDLITALAVGGDFSCRVAMAVDAGPTEHGWLGSAVYGSFGASAAAGKILGFSPSQMSNAIGIAYAQTGGSREMAEGTSLRGVRDGITSKVGVMSALLAEKGLTGPGRFLEGKAGLYNLYFRGKYTPERLLHEFGKTFEVANVSYKIWPSCRLTHTYVEATTAIMKEQNLSWEDIKEVHVDVSQWGKDLSEPPARRLMPRSSVEAGDSMPFTLGIAMVHQTIKIEHFFEAGLKDERVLSSAKKIIHHFKPELRASDMTPGDVTIRTNRGAEFRKRVEFAPGSPQNPLKKGALEEKFLDCLRYSAKPITDQHAKDIIRDVLDLENQDSIECIIP